jgi:site-specific DNA recombinase
MKNLSGKRAVLYRRVSTTDQKDFGNSLTTQQNRLNEFCNRHSIDVVKDFEEDYSAKNFNRPVFSELMSYVSTNKKQIDLVLIYKWDRFSRNTMEALTMISQLKGYGVEVNCSEQWVNHDDPNQLIMLLLNLGIPEADNRIRRDRTIEGTRSNLKEGRWVYSQPRGYMKGKDENGKVLMKPDPKLAPLITELFSDFSLGIYSQNQIQKLPKYKELNLNKSSLSRILNQITYSGRILIPAYKDEHEEVVEALHEPLVSIDIYEKVQVELGNRKRIKHKPVKQNEYLPLRGYLTCNRCGNNLTGSGSKSKTGKKHFYYHCNTRRGCNERFKVSLAHDAIYERFNSLKPNEEVLNLFKVILKDKFENSETSNKTKIKSLDVRINKNIKRKSVLLTKLLDGQIDDDLFKSKKLELSSEIQNLKLEKQQLSSYEKESVKFINFGIHVIQNVGELFKNAKIHTKQRLLSSIFKEKLVFDGEKYRTPILNKGIELLSKSIVALESLKNKNGRLSFDNIPLSTRGGT